MQRKRIKYLAAGIIIFLIAYNSVYFKSLSEVKAASASGVFDAGAYAENFWTGKLMPGLDAAVEINELIAKLKTNKENAFKEHSHAISIGNIRYFLIKGKGEVKGIRENEILLLLQSGPSQPAIKLETEFIYGNAVRDALGVIDINDFNSTSDLNSVSEEINKKIRTEVVPPFKDKVQKGNMVEFVGAIELNRQYLNLEEIEVIPVKLAMAQ